MEIKQTTIPAEEPAFEKMFATHYKGMYCYACTILKDEINAEEITQNIFVKLWERRNHVIIQSTLQGYLYRMVHNDCMNLLKHEAVKAKFEKEKIYTMKNESDSANKKILSGQLEEKLSDALRELPEQCRTIFQLSRFEDLKYREIAEHLGIAEKTVENQMGKALKLLRIKLVDFLPLIIIITALMKKI
ncbi:MAG: RNA polymerase sigma-70 factor [Panacibacter sp.]